jgi:hypothetical protein
MGFFDERRYIQCAYASPKAIDRAKQALVDVDNLRLIHLENIRLNDADRHS